jgi:hypothetical protein
LSSTPGMVVVKTTGDRRVLTVRDRLIEVNRGDVPTATLIYAEQVRMSKKPRRQTASQESLVAADQPHLGLSPSWEFFWPDRTSG